MRQVVRDLGQYIRQDITAVKCCQQCYTQHKESMLCHPNIQGGFQTYWGIQHMGYVQTYGVPKHMWGSPKIWGIQTYGGV